MVERNAVYYKFILRSVRYNIETMGYVYLYEFELPFLKLLKEDLSEYDLYYDDWSRMLSVDSKAIRKTHIAHKAWIVIWNYWAWLTSFAITYGSMFYMDSLKNLINFIIHAICVWLVTMFVYSITIHKWVDNHFRDKLRLLCEKEIKKYLDKNIEM